MVVFVRMSIYNTIVQLKLAQLNSGDKDGGVLSFNPHSAYYILNPHGDLKNTEKRFANFFANERSWSGVMGSPPSHEEFAAALQEKDLYV